MNPFARQIIFIVGWIVLAIVLAQFLQSCRTVCTVNDAYFTECRP